MRQETHGPGQHIRSFAGHEIGRELKAMSAWLDDRRALLGRVAADLRRHGVKETGRQGLPAQSVLRCAVLKQHRQLSDQELAFHLEDSASFRAFARLPCRRPWAGGGGTRLTEGPWWNELVSPAEVDAYRAHHRPGQPSPGHCAGDSGEVRCLYPLDEEADQ
jgi:Transposase domain (DUF772)